MSTIDNARWGQPCFLSCSKPRGHSVSRSISTQRRLTADLVLGSAVVVGPSHSTTCSAVFESLIAFLSKGGRGEGAGQGVKRPRSRTCTVDARNLFYIIGWASRSSVVGVVAGDDGREKKAMVIPVFSLNKSPTFWFCSFACMLPVCRESLDDDDDDRLAALQCSAATSMAEPPQQHRLQRAIMYELRLCFCCCLYNY